MRVSLDWSVRPEAWSRFIARCPGATFFHTPGWYAAHAASREHRVVTCFMRFDDGTEALLPLAEVPGYKGLLRRALAGIENGYGGLLSPDRLTSAHVEGAYQAVRRRYPDLTVVGNPFSPFDVLPGSGERHEDATQVLPILEPEAQRGLMSSTRVKHCKRAAKAGFRLEVRTRLKAADAAAFYPLYAERAAGWAYDRWVRDEAYFRALCAHAGEHLALFLAFAGTELAGFRLLGLYGPHVMDLFLATDEAHEASHVGPFLVAEPLAWCRTEGYRDFDFQPSGRLEGVKAYKASFGAETVPHGHVRYSSLAARGFEALRSLKPASRAS